MVKHSGFWLWGIIILSCVLRLRFLTTPLADWHSFRQADTASVAREYTKNGIDLLRPKYHDISNIQSGIDNPQGYRMVEFPIVGALVALTYRPVSLILPLELHVWYRLTSILFSLGSLVCLYYLVKNLFTPKIAIYTALFFAVVPYNVYYNRGIFPEDPLVFLALLCLWLSILAFKRPRLWVFMLLTLSGALALLLKPTAAFMLLPLLIPAYYSFRRSPGTFGAWFISLLGMILPLFLWRQWLQHFPEGIPYSAWLYNKNGIRLRPAWFRWLFYERLTKLILGFTLLPIFVVGFIPMFKFVPRTLPKKLPFYFLFAWGIGLLAYLIIFATGNVQHDYYQIMTVPLICILLGLGVDYLFKFRVRYLNYLIILLVGLGLFFSWAIVGGYYHINRWEIVRAGQAVDRLTPPDALVISPYQGDTAFLYQTNRRGWPQGFNILDKIMAGATYYVTVNFDDEATALMSKYPIVEKTPEYVILKLR